jgi:hypothetical protein
MSILPIRINGTNTAIKLKLSSAPDFLYYLPSQNVSSVFVSGSKKFFSSKNNTNIATKHFQGFLPSNYTDAFYSKNTILTDVDYDPSSNDALAVSTNGIQCLFVEHEGADLSSYGLAFNIPTKLLELSNINGLIILNITLNSDLIVSIVYENFYVNTEVSVKHPLLSQYLTLNLPNSDSEHSL